MQQGGRLRAAYAVETLATATEAAVGLPECVLSCFPDFAKVWRKTLLLGEFVMHIERIARASAPFTHEGELRSRSHAAAARSEGGMQDSLLKRRVQRSEGVCFELPATPPPPC